MSTIFIISLKEKRTAKIIDWSKKQITSFNDKFNQGMFYSQYNSMEGSTGVIPNFVKQKAKQFFFQKKKKEGF